MTSGVRQYTKRQRFGEFEIQRGLRSTLFHRGYRWIFPNANTITGYEADLIAVSSSMYAYEYEIKCSLSDFKNDLSKLEKHAALSGSIDTEPHPFIPGLSILKNKSMMRNRKYRIVFRDRRPKQFWYVIHGFELSPEEVPAYAGLMVAKQDDPWMYEGELRPSSGCKFRVIKDAPDILPAFKVDKARLHRTITNMSYKYWDIASDLISASMSRDHYGDKVKRLEKELKELAKGKEGE